MKSDAIISACTLFRYHLSRIWIDEMPRMVFVMMNPSVADAAFDDPTIKRCIAFAKSGGYGGIEVVNLYAFRATNPKDLKNEGWPVGSQNDTILQVVFDKACRYGWPVVCAWGADAARTPRAGEVLGIMAAARVAPYCLAVTRDGFPRHPLYLKGDCKLQPYRP